MTNLPVADPREIEDGLIGKYIQKIALLKK